MKSQKESSKQILKSISIFGGVQVFLILINLIKVKAVAMFIGVNGVGQFSIFNNILTLIALFAYLGLNFSAVRSISLSFEENDHQKIERTYNVFNYWTILCAFFGLIITLVGAKYISLASFDSDSRKIEIAILSLGVLFTILYNGNNAFLQGSRKLKEMARSSFLSALIGVVISVPLFYFFKQGAIIYSIVLSALLSFLFSYFLVRKSKIKRIKIPVREIWNEGSDMVKLGLVMMISSFIGTLITYLINIFIVKFGSLNDLGLFSAGNGITTQYIGVVFTAMAADYFPKLSAISNDRDKVNDLVNNQGEILLIIVCPILLALISFAPLLISILLSEKFLAISTFIGIMSLAMLFKAASYPIGYISFAKGDKKVFFLFEGILNSVLILLGHTLGYYFGGINGIAWGVLILYIVYFISINVLTRNKYHFVLQKEYRNILLVSTLILGLGLLNVLFINNIYIKYGNTIILGLFSIFYSYKKMNNKMDISIFIKSKVERFKSKNK
ncbi:oligosaccharide flippase family protein [Chryseobacterium sp. SIMBA_038]|uniref:oligosaccharide flippase family protein n=1 Tax=Chryseobacterium sp. SIMBA_038 TaxID=3085780 RepID=UPI003977ECDE